MSNYSEILLQIEPIMGEIHHNNMYGIQNEIVNISVHNAVQPFIWKYNYFKILKIIN